MKRILILFMVLAVIYGAKAAQSVTQINIPNPGFINWSISNTMSVGGDEDDLYCWDFIPLVGITGATYVAFKGGQSATTSGLFTIAVYENGGANKLFHASTQNDTNQLAVISITSTTLWAGTMYRLCVCADLNGGGANGQWTSVGGPGTGTSTPKQAFTDFMNVLGVTHAGMNSTGCTSGVPPSTATSLGTNDSNHFPPLVILSTQYQTTTTSTSSTTTTSTSSTTTTTTP